MRQSGVAPHCHPVRAFAPLRHATGGSSPPLLLQIHTTQSLHSLLCSLKVGIVHCALLWLLYVIISFKSCTFLA